MTVQQLAAEAKQQGLSDSEVYEELLDLGDYDLAEKWRAFIDRKTFRGSFRRWNDKKPEKKV